MPRPRKWRIVCGLPEWNRFGPLGVPAKGESAIHMSVEEFETIRLIDIEDLTQEECAARMNVARTTVQGIYNKARKKIAEALVHGKGLVIEGGDYRICEGFKETCGQGNCIRRRRGGQRGNRNHNIIDKG